MTRSKMKKPTTRPPASARHIRSVCTTEKFVADGNACLCASGMVRYCTACAAEPTERTSAAGAVHAIHQVTAHLPGKHAHSSMRCGATYRSSEEESHTAQD